ncbi:ABC transporter substrate-binding protein, partial [Curtobacterium sp. MCBA15_013]
AIQTWADFRTFGKQIKQKTGAATIITATQLFNQFVSASPTRYFDRDDQPLYHDDDSSIRKAWENAVESIHAGITGNLQSGTDQNAGWVAGRVAGQIEGAWWTQIIHDTAPDLSGKWRIARQPERPGNSGGSFLAVPKTSKNPEAAVAFAKWITGADVQSHTYNDIQLFPSTPASFENGIMRNPGDFFGDQNPLDFFSKAAPEVPVTYISNSERFIGAFATEITNVESGGKDPERAWQDAIDQTDRVLAKRGVSA